MAAVAATSCWSPLLKILHPNGRVLPLFGPDEHREAGTRPVGRLHRALEPPAPNAMSARTPARRRAVMRVEHVGVRVLAERHAEDLAAGPRAGGPPRPRSDSMASTIRSRPTAKPMPGSGGPPISSRQAVVAAAAADAGLGAEQRVVELVGGPHVVVEAADQAGRVVEGDAEARPAARAPRRGAPCSRRRGSRSMYGASCRLRADLGALVVEDAQRVDLDPLRGCPRRGRASAQERPAAPPGRPGGSSCRPGCSAAA